MATLLHNKLYETALTDMSLANCSLLYFILRNCKLTRVSINAESVGAIFGLRREQLEELDIVYLGEKQSVPHNTDIVKLISDEYSKRAWYIAQFVIELNFRTVPTISAFESYMDRSYRRFVELGFVKGEELDFLGDVIQELEFLERLPLISVFDLIDWCTSLESEIHQRQPEREERFQDPLRTFVSRMAILANTLLEKVDVFVPRGVVEEPNRVVCFKATFKQKPEVPFLDVLNWIASIPSLGIVRKSRFTQASTGSYVEVVYTTLLTIYALKLFLFHVNGCLVQLTEMRSRVSVLVAKRTSKSFLELAASPPPRMLPLVKSLLPTFREQAKTMAFSKEQLLSGYDSDNLVELSEVQCSKEKKAGKKLSKSKGSSKQRVRK